MLRSNNDTQLVVQNLVIKHSWLKNGHSLAIGHLEMVGAKGDELEPPAKARGIWS